MGVTVGPLNVQPLKQKIREAFQIEMTTLFMDDIGATQVLCVLSTTSVLEYYMIGLAKSLPSMENKGKIPGSVLRTDWVYGCPC